MRSEGYSFYKIAHQFGMTTESIKGRYYKIKPKTQQKNINMTELVIKSEKGNPVTNSLLVSNRFNKDHKHVLDSIRKLIADNSAAKFFYEGTYTNRGKHYPVFYMGRDGFSLLVMGFNGKEALKFKIEYIDAFNKMESELNTMQLPKTFSEALQLAADQSRQLELQAPKVQSYDTFIDSKSLQGFKEVANILGYGRNKLTAKLRDLKIITIRNIPYQQYLNMGLFEVKESSQNGFNTATTYITPKGIEYIRKKIA